MRTHGYFQTLAAVCYGLALGGGILSAAPPSAKELETSIAHGLDFLIHTQNQDGSWGSPHRTKDLNIYAPVPGAHQAFTCAVTAMCVQALIETGAVEKDDAAKRACDRGEVWLLENLPNLRRADPVALYNIWGHAFGIQALTALYPHEAQNPKRQKQIQKVILGQMDLLQRFESVDGGWGYYDFRVGAKQPTSSSLSFVTATVLVALHDAKGIGIEVPPKFVERAVASLVRQEKKDHSYLYGEYLQWRPMMDINRPNGSLGRSQACNLALRSWGDPTITHSVLTEWLDMLVTHNDWLSFGRKRPVPHESWFQVAGYFFYYGHYYAARCIKELPAPEAEKYQDHLAEILLPLQEQDGSWWDFPLYDYHQQYGTAFALMSLARCRKSAP